MLEKKAVALVSIADTQTVVDPGIINVSLRMRSDDAVSSIDKFRMQIAKALEEGPEAAGFKPIHFSRVTFQHDYRYASTGVLGSPIFAKGLEVKEFTAELMITKANMDEYNLIQDAFMSRKNIKLTVSTDGGSYMYGNFSIIEFNATI